MSKVKIWESAGKQIRKLIKKNSSLEDKIQNWIDFLKNSKIPNPPKIQKLKWDLKTFYKLKIPPLRFLFRIEWDLILIESVKLRKDAYR